MQAEEIREDEDDNPADSELFDTAIRSRQCESLKLKCPACGHVTSYSKTDDTPGLQCTCGEAFDKVTVYCQVMIATRRFVSTYYDSPYQCTESACGFQTRDQLPVDNESCLQFGCSGQLVR
jgi:hypothetical protein